MAKSKKKAISKKQKSKKSVPAQQTVSPLELMERRFDDFFSRGWMRPSHWDIPSFSELMPHFETKLPKVDVIDRDKEVLVRAEVPGVDKKDLEVSATENSVTIKGSTRHEEKEEKGDYYRSEISRGSFSRTVGLPGEVNTDKAKAKFKDGVLELTIPKVAHARRRTVTVE
ncbi:MAG TPA: Hsp20/alpha crystallin family protein [Chromatiales bacterium]|nr:Hsp20/alpha crystallin family protein [Thiotrichales bacterium]HIP69577.1 Hsp20/alpha crystallin family protein [Chromatiales bacterium]